MAELVSDTALTVADGEAMPTRMDDRELAALLDQLNREAVGYLNSEIAAEQEEALERYYGRPMGNERDGRSKVIDRVVSVVVDNALAATLKPFVSADEVVSFAPTGPEDEEAAKQATDYVNCVVMQDNPGFILMHNWFKDALLQKIGVLKVWWQDKTAPKRETITVDAETWQAMQAQPDFTVIAGPFETATPGVFEVEIERTYVDGCVKIDGVPPEDFYVTPQCKSIEEAPYLGHRVRMTRSQLVALGFDMERVYALATYSRDSIEDGRERQRFKDEEGFSRGQQAEGDPSQETLLVHHEFPLIDMDGDGIAERREIIRVDMEILYNEEVPDHPFAALCPKPMPHKVYGLSLADDVLDLERINTALMRGMLDNLYASNNPRPVIAEDGATEDTVDDLLNPAPGAPIRMRRADALGAFAVPFTADKSFSGLELMERRITARTGVSLLGQGMDENTLKKEQTATEAAIQDDGRNARLEMVARIFAETGVKDLFRKVLRLLVRHQPRERVIRLRNEWVQIDPRSWNANMDVQISVGLGVGNKATKVANAEGALQALERLAMTPYAFMVKPEGVYTAFKDLFAAIGYKNIDAILQEPTEEVLAQQAQNQQPDPETMKVQAELQMKQAEMQAKQQEAAMKLQLQQAEAETKQQLERERAEFEAQLASAKADREFALAQERMAMEMRLAEQRMAFEMEMAREKAEADRAAKVEAAKIGADAKISSNRPGGSLSE